MDATSKYDKYPLIGHLFQAFDDYENNTINLERSKYVIQGIESAMEGNYPEEQRESLREFGVEIFVMLELDDEIEYQHQQALKLIAEIKEKIERLIP